MALIDVNYFWRRVASPAFRTTCVTGFRTQLIANMTIDDAISRLS
jgi:hypothetical protein